MDKYFDKEMRKILRHNFIKFVIGVVLLILCFLYIQRFPAEKTAIFAGFDVMIQRVQIFINKTFHRDSESLKSKFDYEKAYQELIKIAEANGCNDKNLEQEMKDTLFALQSESTTNLGNVLPGYIRKANEYKTRVSEQCKNK